MKDDLESLKQEIFSRRPVLAEIYRVHGRESLPEYVDSWRVGPSRPDKKITEIIRHQSGVFAPSLAEEAAKQICDNPLVSTIDHHGIFGHPFFLNANLLFSLRKNLRYLPVFSTSGVSLNNSSWPGCLVLTDFRTGKLVRLSLFNDAHKNKTVFGVSASKASDVEKAIRQIQRLDFLNPGQKDKLRQLMQKIFLAEDFLGQKDFSRQAAWASGALWREVFPEAPQLVYFSLEDFCIHLFEEQILTDVNHILHSLLFTDSGLELLEKYFTGVQGAFGGGHGSFLFWGVDEAGRRFAFKRQGRKIINSEKLSYELAPGAIAEAFLNRKIYPTSLMCFLLLLINQFNCLGGFNQTSWLTNIKEKFLALLSEAGHDPKIIAGVVTDNFAETPLALARLGGSFIKPSLLDLYLNGADYVSLANPAKKITLEQSLSLELPEIYRIVVPAGERKKSLEDIAVADIVRKVGLTENFGLI